MMAAEEPLEAPRLSALKIEPEATRDYFSSKYFSVIGLYEHQFKQFYQAVLSFRRCKH